MCSTGPKPRLSHEHTASLLQDFFHVYMRYVRSLQLPLAGTRESGRTDRTVVLRGTWFYDVCSCCCFLTFPIVCATRQKQVRLAYLLEALVTTNSVALDLNSATVRIISDFNPQVRNGASRCGRGDGLQLRFALMKPRPKASLNKPKARIQGDPKILLQTLENGAPYDVPRCFCGQALEYPDGVDKAVGLDIAVLPLLAGRTLASRAASGLCLDVFSAHPPRARFGRSLKPPRPPHPLNFQECAES